MRELRPGVWFWQARHPEWQSGTGWDELVSSYVLDDGRQLTVIDPIAPPPKIEELAAVRTPVIVLTCQWHRRDSESLAARLGAPIFVPVPNPEDSEPPVSGNLYSPGASLPGGLEALRGLDDSDLVLWCAHHRAVAIGDALVERGGELVLPLDWAATRGGPEPIRSSLQPLLERPVDLVLPTHGLPADHQALARALGVS